MKTQLVHFQIPRENNQDGVMSVDLFSSGDGWVHFYSKPRLLYVLVFFWPVHVVM